MPNDKILEKLGKLKAHQESAEKIGSEAEAQAFAAMLNQLLMKHKLEMTDLEYEAEVKDEPADQYPVGGGVTWGAKRTYKDYPDVEIKGSRIKWSEDLAQIIGDTYACKLLVSQGTSRLWFVGTKSNVAIAEYTYIQMYRTIESLGWKEYKTLRNKIKWAQVKTGIGASDVDYSQAQGYRASWIEGFISKLRSLFYEERKATEKVEGGSTALIRIDKDRDAVEKYMDSRGRRTANSLGGQRSYNSQGYRDGQTRAGEINASRRKGVGTSEGSKQLN